jgi:hypothetical protein
MKHLTKGEKSSVIGQFRNDYDDNGNEAIEITKKELHQKSDEKDRLEEEIKKYKAEKIDWVENKVASKIGVLLIITL